MSLRHWFGLMFALGFSGGLAAAGILARLTGTTLPGGILALGIALACVITLRRWRDRGDR